MSQVQRNLGADNTEKLRQYVLFEESRGNYQIENRFGYMGGYQFGAQAAQRLGLIKPGIETDYKKLGSTPAARAVAHKALLDNTNNWTIPGGKTTFLADKALQDRAFLNLADRNYNTLTKAGLITAQTPPEKVAGYLAASHLIGAGAVIKNPNMDTPDANGTKGISYYQGAAGVISGKTEIPPTRLPESERSRSASAGKPPSENAPSKQPFTGQGVNLNESELNAEIEVSTFSKNKQQFISLPQDNQLSRFSSFNTIFTLSNLSTRECNFPETSYKQGNLGKIIAKSGGAGDSTPVLATGSQYDFFINDLEYELLMTHNRQTKGTNATLFTFTVLEPYSMGLFLQALSIVATENEHPNYLASPFLLTMEFVGYLENGFSVKLPDQTRHLPIRITNVQMNVTSSGAKYTVNALAWNEQAYFDEVSRFKTDIGIAGSTVLELLQTGSQSLQTVLNKRLQELAGKEAAAKASDEIVIIFPKEIIEEEITQDNSDAPEDDTAATEDQLGKLIRNLVDGKLTLTRGQGNIRTQEKTTVNEIGASSMDFDMTKAGESAPVKDNDAQANPDKGINRSKVKYDPKSRLYLFEQGSSIVNAISSVVTMSKYCKDAVDPNNPKIDEKGMIPWFRIESEVYIQPSKPGNTASNRHPLLLVYKVVPYLVHSNKLIASNTENKGLEKLEFEVAKIYDYIYTGKNTEVLRFDLDFKTAIFTPSTADQSKASFLAAYSRQLAVGDSSSAQTTANLSGNDKEELSGGTVPGQSLEQNPEHGGSTAVDYRTLIAQNFNRALYDGQVDLVNAEMEIMGDPYYIADSGLGNFSNSGSGSFNMTDNYAMDYQSGEVHIRVNFRTPVDYGSNGIMDFGPTKIVESFSGLYKVNSVVNRISKGAFTQTLKMLRVPNQYPQVTEFLTLEGSEQTKQLREQEEVFNDRQAERDAEDLRVESSDTVLRGGRGTDYGTDNDKPDSATVNPQERPRVGRGKRNTNNSSAQRPQTSAVTPGIQDAAPEEQFTIYAP
jgi:hypothetical protein